MEAAEIALTSTARVTGELAHETLSVDPGASLEARLSRLSQENKIAAKIPKPKLNMPELERPALAPPAREDTENAPPAAETADTADTADSGETDAPESPTTEIPQVFDRRKKQATG